MKLTANDIGKFAVWKYDLFPCIKGGTIVRVDDTMAVIKEYGVGYWFTPIAVMTVNEGKEFLQEVETLAFERSKMIAVIKEYNTKLEQLSQNFNIDI